MKLYIDISEFLNNRFNTGIQRVVQEFLQKVIQSDYDFSIISYDKESDYFQSLHPQKVDAFLKDIKNYTFSGLKEINLFKQESCTKIFFDIDSVWNSPYQRIALYKKLKNHKFKIYNFIYDLIPVLFPNLVKDNTRNSFDSFLNAVYNYSDFVFFDSISSQQDFLNLKKEKQITRAIQTKVVYLGSDFKKQLLTQTSSTPHNELLSKKYILFVGTIEPRKQQPLVLQAFEELYKTNPELHLVFIGSIGWQVEAFKHTLQNHPLKDKNLHHLTGVDDATLFKFYQNAFVVTYLSLYEGYGLPIAESLLHANITITSKNSSMPEVGKDAADYISDSKEELINLLSSYLHNDKLYATRKEYIKNNYEHPTWNEFCNNIFKELK